MIEVFDTLSSLHDYRQSLYLSQQSLGFVPTMGALHQGHLALIERAIQENDQVVCSIYVNPTQFNNTDDLQNYPRQVVQDLAQLEKYNKVKVFLPNDQIMYPKPASLRFDFGYLEQVMEGHFRPGHFNGVALVVAKLFHLVKPHRAYFGQKDLQQTLIITQLVQDLSFEIELIICPTFREENGLAMSSRNQRLSSTQRQQAQLIPDTLFSMQALLQSHQKSIEEVKNTVRIIFEKGGLQLEYFEVVDRFTLQPIKKIHPHQEIALCIAAYLGEVRLIDNVIFTSNS